MKTRYYIIIISLCLSFTSFGQTQWNAIRYSQLYTSGTARFSAMGGAFGAVGGDFTSASTNPAGLGLYRGSEFTFTPNYSLVKAKADYLGNTSKESETNLSVGNLGIVNTYNSKRNNGLVSATIAFGYNALNDFHRTTTMQGINNNTSLLDNFVWYANNKNELQEFYEALAFETALMPMTQDSGSYWHYLQPYEPYGYEGYGQRQTRIVEKRGYIGEYLFSTALNISDKLFLGGTFGVHALRYYEDIYHEETDIEDLEPEFYSFRFGEYNTTRGYGYVFKVGFIFKPIHMLRIGASFHAPVIYDLTDDKYTDLNTYWDSNAPMSDDFASSNVYSKEYTLKTPYRANLSTAIILGKLGILSAEYEYVDYSSADMDSPGYKYIDENLLIAKDFGVAHNVKAGAELRLNPVYVRGGVQYYMNPFTDKRNGSDIFVYSGGIGIRSNQTSFDIAYSMTTSSEIYGLYQYAPEFETGFEKSVNRYNKSNVRVTLGYKF